MIVNLGLSLKLRGGFIFALLFALSFTIDSVRADGICDRSLEVRVALLRDVISRRVEKGQDSFLRCEEVSAEDLTQVESVFLFDRSIEHLQVDDFAGLENLRYLDLGANRIRDLPTGIFRDLVSLEYLDLSENNLSDLGDELVPLSQLTHLYLYENQITSLKSQVFASLTRLEVMLIGGNRLTALPPDLLVSHPEIRELSFSQNYIRSLSDNQFAFTLKLRRLELDHNHLSEFPSRELVKLPYLKGINLIGNRFSQEKQSEIKSTLEYSHQIRVLLSEKERRARVLSLDHRSTAIRAALRSQGLGVDEVEKLDLSHQSIQRLRLDDFSGMESLREINLSQNQLTRLPDGMLRGLRSLKRLHLEGNPLPSQELSRISKVASEMGVVLTYGQAVDPLLLKNGLCDRTEYFQSYLLKRVRQTLLDELTCDSVNGGHLSKIVAISLSQSMPLQEKLLSSDFFGLINLEILSLGNRFQNIDSLFGDFLVQFPRLRELDLMDLPIGDRLNELSPVFQKLPRLEKLNLSHTGLKSFPVQILDAIPHLRSLSLYGNSLSLETKKELIHLSRERKFDLFFERHIERFEHQASDDKPSLDASQEELQEASREGSREASEAEQPVFLLEEGVQGAETRYFSRRVKRMQDFVLKVWHMPLQIRVTYSEPDSGISSQSVLRAEEAKRAIRQLEEVIDAYIRSSFDFYSVDIEYQSGPERVVDYSGRRGKLTLQLPSAQSVLRQHRRRRVERDYVSFATTLSDDEILRELSDEFDWERETYWYFQSGKLSVPRSEIYEGLRRDLQKLLKIDEDLHHDLTRLEILKNTVNQRAEEQDEAVLYTPSEVRFARLVQIRTIIGLQRALNTMARWNGAHQDELFPFRQEVSVVSSYAATVYSAGLEWFLDVVVEKRALLNIFSPSWWSRSELFTLLDARVESGYFNFNGVTSQEIDSGAVRLFLERRADWGLQDFLENYVDLFERIKRYDFTGSDMEPEIQKVLPRMETNLGVVRDKDFGGIRSVKEIIDDFIKNTWKLPFYQITVGVATFLGDWRLANPPPAIQPHQLKDLEDVLKPGDLILIRQEHFASNEFLPGFYTHSIIYLGPEKTADQKGWTELKMSNGVALGEDPRVQDLLREYRTPHHKGRHPNRVIEAISDGVVFNSMEYSVAKDFVVAFRVQVPGEAEEAREARIADSIRVALRYFGRPYDFDFDFATEGEIVCTELLYRAFDDDVNMSVQKNASVKPNIRVPGVVRVMGRDTMPAQELARLVVYQYDHPNPRPEINYPGRRLEMIRLLEMNPKDRDLPALVYDGLDAVGALRNQLER